MYYIVFFYKESISPISLSWFKLFNKRGVLVEGKQVTRNIDCISFLKKGETPDFPIVEHGVRIWELETEEYNLDFPVIYKNKTVLRNLVKLEKGLKSHWKDDKI